MVEFFKIFVFKNVKRKKGKTTEKGGKCSTVDKQNHHMLPPPPPPPPLKKIIKGIMGHKVHDDDNDDGDRKAVYKRAHLKVRLT